MSVFQTPVWDVDNSGNVLCDKFVKVRKQSNRSKISKERKRSLNTSLSGWAIPNNSKLPSPSPKGRKFQGKQGNREFSRKASEKSCNNENNSVLQSVKKQVILGNKEVNIGVRSNIHGINSKKKIRKMREQKFQNCEGMAQVPAVQDNVSRREKKRMKGKNSKPNIILQGKTNINKKVKAESRNSYNLKKCKTETEDSQACDVVRYKSKNQSKIACNSKVKSSIPRRNKPKFQSTEKISVLSMSSKQLGKRSFDQVACSIEENMPNRSNVQFEKNSSSVGEFVVSSKKRRKLDSQESNLLKEFHNSSSIKQLSPNNKRKWKKFKEQVANQEPSLSSESVINLKGKNEVPIKINRKVNNSSLSLRERMLNQLKSSRFRFINEQLYTSNSINAKNLFEKDPSLFMIYHEGYKQQVQQWPLNPVDKMIKAIKRKAPNLVVADFGCGDAALAKSLPNKVHSFDLVALSDEVVVCDIAHTPLEDGSIDICVFCLSLMGTNLGNYLIEANRVLKDGGELKIAEVASRFDNIEAFIKDLKKYGFSILNKDFSHNLFFFMNFSKCSNVNKIKKLPALNLKPCWYKKR